MVNQSFQIEIANEQPEAVDEARFRLAVENILLDAGVASARISIAVVDSPTMHQLNIQYLQHDYPTDVLSFLLSENDQAEPLEGEVIVCLETARQEAENYAWEPHNELLLYVIHGTLHLVGYDDKRPDEIAAMRQAEEKQLKKMGLSPPSDLRQ